MTWTDAQGNLIARVLSDLFSHEQGEAMMEQLVKTYKDGIAFVTEFSGVDVPGQVLFAIGEELKAFKKISCCNVCYISACDIDPKCRAVLAAFPRSTKPVHIGEDILQKLPADVRQEPTALTEQLCTTRACDVSDNAFADEVMELLCQRCGDPSTLSQPCTLHPGQKCNLLHDPCASSTKGIRLLVAGVTCTDFTVAGSRKGFRGLSALPLLVFIWSRREAVDDIIIIEEAASFARAMMPTLQKFLGAAYNLEHVLLCPSAFGLAHDSQTNVRSADLAQERLDQDTFHTAAATLLHEDCRAERGRALRGP